MSPGPNANFSVQNRIDPAEITDRRFLHLLQRIEALGLPSGREDAFKLTREGLIMGRVLVGIPAVGAKVETLLALARQFLAMPEDGHAILHAHVAQASAVFFGVENSSRGVVYKVYLEFWEQVKHAVRMNPSTGPLLLHLGIKWTSERPAHHEVAQYMCHPLLSVKKVMRRITAIYTPGQQANACTPVLEMVRQGIKHNPAASLLYLEVSETRNPRRSFDVNLYQTGISLSSCSTALRKAAAHFGVAKSEIELPLELFGHCALGHLSGGTDRHGQEFMSIYLETKTLRAS